MLLAASAAQSQVRLNVGFSEPPTRRLEVGMFSDEKLDELLRTLDDAMAVPHILEDPTTDPELNLWKFMRWLQSGTLTSEQENRVVAQLHDLAEQFPDRAALLEKQAGAVRRLTIGKVAPDIEGPDLDGVDFRLSDYRGKVVLLTFTGDWCAICRVEYPYHRLLSELYAEWPFAILTVNSDPRVELARKADAKKGLLSRSWWETRGDSKRPGRIATAYNLYGWPTTYLIDDTGTIRFVDLRQEDTLKAVRQLLTELERRAVDTEARR
jgi:peroxiredoxin